MKPFAAAFFKNQDVKVASGQWHTLRAVFVAEQFTVTFDSQQVILAKDTSINKPGKVDLRTKPDSVTFFDDFDYGAQ